MTIKEHDVTIEGGGGVTVVIAEAVDDVGVHVYWDDSSHPLRFTSAATKIEALEQLAQRWEQLARKLRDLRFATSCVREGAPEPCLDCDECRYHAPGSCREPT